jgi:nitronate monooxygenase
MDIVSGSRLAAAVSLAGGLGILGGGYGERTWLMRELAASISCSPRDSAPFGVGFITWSLAKQPELLDIALQAGPRAVMLSFGDPATFAPAIKKADAVMICQVQSEEMAEEALRADADVLVAQGTEAGGHGADRSTMDIVPAIVDLVAGRVLYTLSGAPHEAFVTFPMPRNT